MKKTFYMMRHGQTVFNLKGKIQGSCDSLLTELGVKQAQLTSEFFKDIKLDHLYCSTTERASDTLEIVTQSRMPYTRLKSLKEINFGIFEGDNEDELNRSYPGLFSQLVMYFERGKGDFDQEEFEAFLVKNGGELREAYQERIVKTCHRIMEQDDHQNVLVVSHMGACLCFLEHCYEEAASFSRENFSNCAILKYEYENGKFTFIELIQKC